MAFAVCLGIMGIIFFGDLFLKNHIERAMKVGESRELFGGRILLKKHHNRGMMLGLGQRRSRAVAFASLILVLACFVLFWFSLGQHGNRLMRAGLSFLLGGAFNNTYDRLRRKYVVDYFSFGVPWKWLQGIVFNLSDFFIMGGALLTTLGAM